MYLAKKQKEPIIIVTTIEAVMQKMVAKDTLYQNVIDFEVGKTYLLDGIKEKLVGLGYERSDLIENKGQFSIRGGIVDVGLSEKLVLELNSGEMKLIQLGFSNIFTKINRNAKRNNYIPST